MDTEQASAETLADTARRRIGAQLAAARTAAGIELADIARDTRVPLRHLQAIEADAHDSLPALPYTIGFVKSFARALGMDPEAAAAQFRAETTKTAHVPAPVSIEPLDERRLPPRGLVMASLAALVVLVGGVIAYSAGLFDAATPPQPVVVAAPAPVAAVPAASAGAPAATATGAIPPSAAGPGTAAATGAVSITATEDVWVKIYDRARNQIKSGVIKSGERYDVPADPPGLLLWTGKPGMLKVTVDGKPIPPLGAAVETVKDVSLAPADLLARAAAAPTPGAPAVVR